MQTKDQAQAEKVRTPAEIMWDMQRVLPASVFASAQFSGPAVITHDEDGGFARVNLFDDGAEEAVIDIIYDDDRQRQMTGRLMELPRELARAI